VGVGGGDVGAAVDGPCLLTNGGGQHLSDDWGSARCGFGPAVAGLLEYLSALTRPPFAVVDGAHPQPGKAPSQHGSVASAAPAIIISSASNAAAAVAAGVPQAGSPARVMAFLAGEACRQWPRGWVEGVLRALGSVAVTGDAAGGYLTLLHTRSLTCTQCRCTPHLLADHVVRHGVIICGRGNIDGGLAAPRKCQ
jgi:hypothetical protein